MHLEVIRCTFSPLAKAQPVSDRAQSCLRVARSRRRRTSDVFFHFSSSHNTIIRSSPPSFFSTVALAYSSILLEAQLRKMVRSSPWIQLLVPSHACPLTPSLDGLVRLRNFHGRRYDTLSSAIGRSRSEQTRRFVCKNGNDYLNDDDKIDFSMRALPSNSTGGFK